MRARRELSATDRLILNCGQVFRTSPDLDTTLQASIPHQCEDFEPLAKLARSLTATAGSDVVQSGRPIFDDFFQHLWPYIGNNTANVVFQMVKRLWLIRIDQ
ncbi:hypothetical protein TNCV_1432671 [Trichonephila clavipes]|nr:hypothetical protein TNCV_1432671 [Trichonephila clavipes]